MYDIIELSSKKVVDLKAIAKELNIPKAEKLLKQDLIYKILDHQALHPSPEVLRKEKKEVKPARKTRKRVSKTPEASTNKEKVEIFYNFSTQIIHSFISVTCIYLIK